MYWEKVPRRVETIYLPDFDEGEEEEPKKPEVEEVSIENATFRDQILKSLGWLRR